MSHTANTYSQGASAIPSGVSKERSYSLAPVSIFASTPPPVRPIRLHAELKVKSVASAALVTKLAK
jgi:hypothetical protein